MTAFPGFDVKKRAAFDLRTHFSGIEEICARVTAFGEITDQPIADPPAPSTGTGTVEDLVGQT